MAAPKKPLSRDDDLSDRPEIRSKLTKLYDKVSKGFQDQRDRSDRNMDYWDLYNCVLSRYQNYTSDKAKLFVPIVRNAVNALVTRYINQAFPQSGRHIECVTGEEEQPYALMSLVEHYIDASFLRTQAAWSILLNGQIEGQYNAYFHWDRVERHVVSEEERPAKIGGAEMPEFGKIKVIVEEDIVDELPMVESLHDSDVLILPQTAESILGALEKGGSVTVIRRWTEAQIDQMIDDGDVSEDAGELLIAAMGQGGDNAEVRDTARKLAQAAGIHSAGGKMFVTGYETWTKLDLGDDGRRLCRVRFSGMDNPILGCKLNPYWNDRCPVRSAPVKKLPGVIKGDSPVAACSDMQLWANDMANEAADAMYFSMAPVLAVDPEKVAKWKDLVTDIAAVWPVRDPGNSIKMFEWPNKARDAVEIIGFCKASIFETMGVNPAMLPQQTGKPGAKRNQAEVALEQQVDILTTADAVTVLENEILTPYVQTAAEYDHQFRDQDMLVRMFGELGLRAEMEMVPPLQWNNRYRLRWSGVETARNAANLQQQIAWVNVAKGIPPSQYMGYRLDLAPLLEQSAGQVFGARLGRQIFKSMRDEQSLDPAVEDKMLEQGFEVLTHAADDDPKHLQQHMQAMQQAMTGGAPPQIVDAFKVHIQRHQQALQMKQAAMAAQGAPGAAGQSGGRQPRSGAQPAAPKPVQGPPGTIRPDSLPKAGAVPMPRRAG